MNDEYAIFINNQQEYRNKLTEIAMKKKMSFRSIANSVGVSTSTMCKFIKEKQDISFVALSKVRDYCHINYKEESKEFIF